MSSDAIILGAAEHFEDPEYTEFIENRRLIDWKFWVTLPAWTPEQAANLLNGLDPSRVKAIGETFAEGHLLDGGEGSVLAEPSIARRARVERVLTEARANGMEPLAPGDWVEWAEGQGYEVWRRLKAALSTPEPPSARVVVTSDTLIAAFPVKPDAAANRDWWRARLAVTCPGFSAHS